MFSVSGNVALHVALLAPLGMAGQKASALKFAATNGIAVSLKSLCSSYDDFCKFTVLCTTLDV